MSGAVHMCIQLSVLSLRGGLIWPVPPWQNHSLPEIQLLNSSLWERYTQENTLVALVKEDISQQIQLLPFIYL